MRFNLAYTLLTSTSLLAYSAFHAVGATEDDEEESSISITLGIASDGYDGTIYNNEGSEDPIEDVYGPFDKQKLKNKAADRSNPDPPLGPPSFPPGKDGKIRVLVTFKEGKENMMKGLQKQGEVHYEFEGLRTVAISIPENALKGLQNNPNILYIEPDLELAIPDDEAVGNHGDADAEDLPTNRVLRGGDHGRFLSEHLGWGVEATGALLAEKRGEGIKVCVLDNGYVQGHEDLPIAETIVVDGATYTGDVDHGTHVAGTIVAIADNDEGIVGLAPKAGIVVGNKLNRDGGAYISDTADAIQRCINKGAKIVNMSYASRALRQCMGSSFSGDYPHSAVNQLYNNNDVLLVAAAGNHGQCTNGVQHYVSGPAGYSNVISVGAVNSLMERADFSAKNNDVDIAGPGVYIESTTKTSGGYDSYDGTSMAAPHVSGVAALVWSTMPWLTNDQVKEYLIDNALNTYADYTGAGSVRTGFFPIAIKRSGKCLDHQGSKSSGGGVHMWGCHGGHQSQWTWDYHTGMIVSSHGLCLDASPPHGNGSLVHMWGCDKNNANQRWVRDGKYLKINGYCLEVDSNSVYNNGGKVQLWSCHGGTNQQWYFGKDYYVDLCRHPDCWNNGNRMESSFGNFGSFTDAPIGDDALTRVYTDENVSIEVFLDVGFGGRSLSFGGNTNINMGGWNDSVSSYKVRLIPDMPSSKVKLCKHDHCNDGVFHAGIGSWRSMPGEIGNDQLSFVHIPRGFYFRYYEHEGYGGWSNKVGSCDYGINLSMNGHNDAVSSFTIGVAC